MPDLRRARFLAAVELDRHARWATYARDACELADHAILAASVAAPASLERAQDALAVARQLDDPTLVARILTACGMLAFYDADMAQSFFTEAVEISRASDDQWLICLIRNMQAITSAFAGDPVAAKAAAQEGRDVADAVGDRFVAQHCRIWLGVALWLQANLAEADELFRALVDEVDVTQDPFAKIFRLVGHGAALAHYGRAAAAQAAAETAIEAAEAFGGFYGDSVHAVAAYAALAGGDAVAARQAAETTWRQTVPLREIYGRSGIPIAEAAMACGDLVAARHWADDAVAVVPGCFRRAALTVRAFIALADGEPDQAERDAHDALAMSPETRGYLRLPDTLECLARLKADTGNHESAARPLGAADAIRQRTGQVRFPIYDADYDAAVISIRDALRAHEFETAWAEGAGLSTEEAIAYAQRGRGARRRPSSGWASLSPTECDVVRLVSEGLANKDIATRLFVSSRTVQTHLTHVYTKLGLTSRVQLVQEAARHD